MRVLTEADLRAARVSPETGSCRLSSPPRSAMRRWVLGTSTPPRRWVMSSGFSASRPPEGLSPGGADGHHRASEPPEQRYLHPVLPGGVRLLRKEWRETLPASRRSPDRRSGAWMPSVRQSVAESSVCTALRSGPTALWQRRGADAGAAVIPAGTIPLQGAGVAGYQQGENRERGGAGP